MTNDLRRGDEHPGRTRALLERLGRVVPDGLLSRVRWLFLLFALLVISTTLATSLESTMAGPGGQLLAVSAAIVAGVWLLYRYRNPAAAVAWDVVGPLMLVVMGWSLHSPSLVYGPAFVLLFFRALYGGRRAALANGLGYFVAVYTSMALVDGVDSLPVTQMVMYFLWFAGIAVMMHAVADVAAGQEASNRRERVLTAVSTKLLRARTPSEIYLIAAEGALELAAAPDASASLWVGTEVLELAASAGPDLLDLRRAPIAHTPAALLERFLAGKPYVLDADETRRVEEAYDHPHRFSQLIVGPMTDDEGQTVGALMVASPRPLEIHLLDSMERFVNEITLAVERTRLLEDLEHANGELRHADQLKDLFLSTVSHELRSPLTSIRGFAQTMRREASRLSDAQRDQFLEVIERQSQRQLGLVNDLLTVSRARAGRLSTEASAVEVAPLLRTVCEELHPASKDVEWRCEPHVVAYVDPVHLHQIATNLLTNAQKYGAPPYVIDAQAVDGGCVLTFYDHGDGIPPEFRDRMFEPFERADSGHEGPSGTGLGLAIVRTLIDANGGTIDYRPDRTPGACFEVTLPASKGHTTDDRLDAAQARASQPRQHEGHRLS